MDSSTMTTSLPLAAQEQGGTHDKLLWRCSLAACCFGELLKILVIGLLLFYYVKNRRAVQRFNSLLQRFAAPPADHPEGGFLGRIMGSMAGGTKEKEWPSPANNELLHDLLASVSGPEINNIKEPETPRTEPTGPETRGPETRGPEQARSEAPSEGPDIGQGEHIVLEDSVSDRQPHFAKPPIHQRRKRNIIRGCGGESPLNLINQKAIESMATEVLRNLTKS